MLEIKGVKKSYGEFQLDCSLNVEKGRITGLVGENGAGKSTLFKAVLGLISYDAGEIKILGKIPEELSEKEKEELGVVLAEAGFSGYLKGKDVEAVLAKLYPKFEAEKFHQMCEEYQIPLDKFIKEYSTGILAFVMWMEKETAMELKLASETEIKKYFQIIELKEASYFNDIVIAVYQLYEYLQTKEIIDRIPFRYEYYLKKEIHCHNNRSVEMEIYERILRELKNFPEIPRLILLHSMLIGLRISEVCTLKGDAYSWQGRDAWIQVYQMKMRTYKRVPIPDVLYKIMKRYLEKYHIGSEDYVFQNKRGGAYQYGSFKWQMKELFNKRQDIFKGYDFKSHDFRHTIATLLYDDEVPLQSIRDYLGHDYEEMTQQYVDFMPKKISAANQEFFKKGENSLASGIKRCKRGK